MLSLGSTTSRSMVICADHPTIHVVDPALLVQHRPSDPFGDVGQAEGERAEQGALEHPPIIAVVEQTFGRIVGPKLVRKPRKPRRREATGLPVRLCSAARQTLAEG